MNWQRMLGCVLVAVALPALATLDISPSMSSAAGRKFGRATDTSVTSDFDGDGFADLAVGVESDPVGWMELVGTVSVLYGSPSGVSARNQFWSQDAPGIKDEAEAGDAFGSAVGTGDFNGDGYADLAVGTPHEDMRGAVNVLYGSPHGLSGSGDQLWHQDRPGMEGEAEDGDEFGQALIAGDFNGDGYGDLAVGVPGEDVEETGGVRHGAVNVLYGSPHGLSAVGNQYWHQASLGIEDDPEQSDQFGHSLSAGDYNGDGFTDLAVGVVGEGLPSAVAQYAGAMHILYGSPSGLSATGSQFWHQDSPRILDVAERFDLFAIDLASGDFNGDGFADVAVGASGEDLSYPRIDTGAVNVLYGSPLGLTAQNNQFWHQDSPGIKDIAEGRETFGWSLSADDFNGDGFADLAVGAPNEHLERPLRSKWAGAVNVLYGSATGLASQNNQFWHQDSPRIKDSVEYFDNFGRTLGSDDYNSDGFADLTVGVPLEDTHMHNAGAVNIICGGIYGLSAAGNQFWHRAKPGIKGEPRDGALFGSSLSGR